MQATGGIITEHIVQLLIFHKTANFAIVRAIKQELCLLSADRAIVRPTVPDPRHQGLR
jgi:hypothetical protein